RPARHLMSSRRYSGSPGYRRAKSSHSAMACRYAVPASSALPSVARILAACLLARAASRTAFGSSACSAANCSKNARAFSRHSPLHRGPLRLLPQPLLGHLGVHLVDGPPGGLPLALGLIPLPLGCIPLPHGLGPLPSDEGGTDPEGDDREAHGRTDDAGRGERPAMAAGRRRRPRPR